MKYKNEVDFNNFMMKPIKKMILMILKSLLEISFDGDIYHFPLQNRTKVRTALGGQENI